MSSLILGISVLRDSAACVLRDGVLVSALQEERLSRRERTEAFPRLATARCLEEAGVSDRDVTDVAVSVLPGAHDRDKLRHAARLGPAREAYLEHGISRPQRRLIAFWEWFHATFDHAPRPPTVHFVDHPLAHLGRYYGCGYDAAALLLVDGTEDWSTTWMGRAEGLGIERLGESHFPHSLGLFHAACTRFCGFEPDRDEDETAGLAAMGDPGRFYRSVRDLIEVGPGGRLRIDTGPFTFDGPSSAPCTADFERTFGTPRRPEEPVSRRHRDVAAAFQRVLEECVLALCAQLSEATGERRLVLGGDVALNAAANGRILRESAFEDLHVPPAPGDSGTCIGAAYHVYHRVLGHATRRARTDPYLGTAYDADDVEAALVQVGVSHSRSANACAEAAARLAQGQVVGWFQGAMEFGPHALGNRSVLADPRRPEIARRVNASIRRREPFWRFAASVPREAASAWFDIGVGSTPTLEACPVRGGRTALLPAVVHADGSARVQAVDRRIDPRFHELLARFGAETGVPVLLNTSLRAPGEPIVESPLDALRCFSSTGIDALFLGDLVVEKAGRAEARHLTAVDSGRDVPDRGSAP